MATPTFTSVGAAFRRALLVLGGLTALATSCMDADPMPTPGRPDRDRILVSSSASSRDGGPVELIGLIGLSRAAPEAGEIVIRQIQSEAVTIAKVGADGAFSALVSGAAGDRFTLTFRLADGDPESDPIELDVARYEKNAAPATPNDSELAAGGSDNRPSVRSSTPSATAPDGRGRVTVTGENMVGGMLLAVGNVRTGEVVESVVSAAGTFSATLAAAAGDTLIVIVRDPVSGATSGMASLSVANP